MMDNNKSTIEWTLDIIWSERHAFSDIRFKNEEQITSTTKKPKLKMCYVNSLITD